MKITICPTCGSKKIKTVRRNSMRELGGERYTVPGLEFYECPACGEKVYDAEAMRKIEAHSPAYTKAQARKRVRVTTDD